MTKPLVSIIINNYNYGRFLRMAIDSAFSQTYSHLEVIVVDDGSTDDSRQVIGQYDDRLRKIFLNHGGQTSALNSAFSESRGEIVCFVDADDMLKPTAIELAIKFFQNDELLVNVHWPLWIMDENNKTTQEIVPKVPFNPSNSLNGILRDGPNGGDCSPTTGNLWSRKFLKEVMPLPVVEQKIGVGSASADACLSMLAPLFGRIESISDPQGYYRIHGRNDYSSLSFEKRLKRNLAVYDHRCELLERFCRQKELAVDPQVWKKKSWEHRILAATEELLSLLAPSESFILVDDEQWATDKSFFGRSRIPFLEKNGEYWGLPGDDATAIHELERLKTENIRVIAFAWTAFWWRDYYKGFWEYLEKNFNQILENEELIVYSLE